MSIIQEPVSVELDGCNVVTEYCTNYTTYTFIFTISGRKHNFTSRYSVLRTLHETLSNNQDFQKAFDNDIPKFPSKNWIKNYSKPNNYKTRAKKLLNYFKTLISKPLILKNEIFQNGIELTTDLKQIMTQIAIEKILSIQKNKYNTHNNKIKNIKRKNQTKKRGKYHYNKHNIKKCQHTSTTSNIIIQKQVKQQNNMQNELDQSDDKLHTLFHKLIGNGCSNQVTKKSFKLLLKIVNNIIQNPDDHKYQNLNCITIMKKLERSDHDTNKSDSFVDLLLISGFRQHDNRLIFDINKLNKLKKLKNLLVTNRDVQMLPETLERSNKNVNNAHESAMSELIESGLTYEEAFKAIQLSYHCNSNDLCTSISKYLSISSQFECEHAEIIDCNENIYNCQSINRLHNSLKECNGNILNMCNDFNHLLFNHNSDEEFEYIHNKMGKCDIFACTIIPRYYRNRSVKDDHNTGNYSDEKYNAKEDIINKIHCYLMHSYDTGKRLTSKERNHLNQYANTNNICSNKSKHLMEIVNQVIQKKQKFQNVSNNSKKFHQITMSAKNDLQSFSFGQKYYYWNFFKNPGVFDILGEGEYSNWNVQKKYISLKEELINNELAILNPMQWKNEYYKAQIYIKSYYCKKNLYADPIDDTNKQLFPQHNNNLYGYAKGTPITTQHIISVIVYCGYSQLSYAFSETYRKLNEKESNKNLKMRHNNFYHLGKYITEAVNLFSKRIGDINSKIFYHGISKEMIFSSMITEMNQPLSTTTDIAVAINFSMNTGMILELHADPRGRCFDCQWVSDFANEKECLFINTYGNLRFTNIINVVNANEYRLAIQAMSIIENLALSNSFASDYTLFDKVIQDFKTQFIQLVQNPIASVNVKSTLFYGAKEISDELQSLTIKLINHELNRCGASNYHKYNAIDSYIDETLHRLCNGTTSIRMNWKLLNTKLSNTFLAGGGYQGYSFLRHLFCQNNYEMIKLNTVTTLFPNAKGIVLEEMSYVSELCLDDILQFLSNNKPTSIKYIYLCLNKNICRTHSELVNKYCNTFTKIGWFLMDLHHSNMGVQNMNQRMKNLYDQMSFTYGIHLGNMFHYPFSNLMDITNNRTE
eukprot:120336_1